MQILYKIDRSPIEVLQTGEGWLKAKITIAKPGVFNYFHENGSMTKEAKLPQDILSSETLESAKGVPVTDHHPEQEDGQPLLVDSENFQEFVKGNISEPEIKNGAIQAIATIYDSKLIKKILNKEQNEASIGFVHDIDDKPGIFENKQYDLAQKNILINHVALVPSGRAGEDVKIHVDKKQGVKKMKWKIDGQETSNYLTYRKFDSDTDIQVDAEIHKELMAIRNDNKNKAKENENLKKEIKDLEIKIKTIKADMKENLEKDNEELLNKLEVANDKAEEWKKKHDSLLDEMPKTVDEKVMERMQLVEFAQSVNKDMKVDNLNNKEIKLQIISEGLPFKSGVKFDSLTDEIIDARFDAACELLREKATIEKKEDQNNSSIKIDRNEIEKKRASLMNVYQRKQDEIEKIREGV